MPIPAGEQLALEARSPGQSFGSLFIWDEDTGDSFLEPGPGQVRASAIYRGHHLLFVGPSGGIFSYDLLTDLACEFPGVNEVGYSFRPRMSQDGRTMVFVSNTDFSPTLSVATKAFLWAKGTVTELAVVNAVGVLHGGIGRIRIDPRARLAVFTTLDGGLYLYSLQSGRAQQVVQARRVGDGFSTQADLREDDRMLTWASGRTAPRSLWMMAISPLLAGASPSIPDSPVSSSSVVPPSSPTASPRDRASSASSRSQGVSVASGSMPSTAGASAPWSGASAMGPVFVARPDSLQPIAVAVDMFHSDLTAPRFVGKKRLRFEALNPSTGLWKPYRWDYGVPGELVQALTIADATVQGDSILYSGIGNP